MAPTYLAHQQQPAPTHLAHQQQPATATAHQQQPSGDRRRGPLGDDLGAHFVFPQRNGPDRRSRWQRRPVPGQRGIVE